MKVCHLITRLDLGGAQRNTLYTVEHLDSRYKPTLVSGRGGILDDEARNALFLDSLKREINPFWDFLAFLQLANHFLATKPDILHTHSSKAGILGRLAAAVAGVPIVVHTFHGFGFNDQQAFPIRGLYIFLEKLCARVSTVLVFVSKSNWETAKKLGIGNEKQYRLIRSGVNLAGYPAPVKDKAAKKAELGLGMHKPLVISVGNLKPQKNPMDFVALAKKVNEKLPDCEFLFIGEGPLRTKVEARIFASNLSHRFKLPGWRHDTAEWLAVADVFVLTSLWEGLPRALVEAMKSNLIPVCYATDGVVDLVNEKTGLLVPPGDVDALAEKTIEVLTKKPKLSPASAIGFEFDIDGMVRSQEKLYDELS